MNVEDIKNILIIGAGTMGHQIGFLCAANGYGVAVYDINPDILKHAEARAKELSERFVHQGRLSPEAAAGALARISFTDDPEMAGGNADLISESVPEDPALKGKIFAQFNQICPEHTIFTTNTSYLVPSMFAAVTGRPERFLAFHFHDVAISNVVDVMPHPGTDPKVTETVRAFAESMGQLPVILKKEQSGYVFNTMLMPLLGSALQLASNEVAAVEDIDRAWMGIMHTEFGPFGIMDTVGLDTVHKITSYWAENAMIPQPERTRNLSDNIWIRDVWAGKAERAFILIRIRPLPQKGL